MPKKILWAARCVCGWPGEPGKVLGLTAFTPGEAEAEAKELHDKYWSRDMPSLAEQFRCSPTVLPIT